MNLSTAAAVFLVVSGCQNVSATNVNCFELQRSVLAGKPIAPKTGQCSSVGYLVRSQIGLLYLVENHESAPDQYGVGIADSTLDREKFPTGERHKVSGK